MERGKVLAAIDFSSASPRVAREAAALATAIGADLTLYHVMPMVEGGVPPLHHKGELEQIADSLRSSKLDVFCRVGFGEPVAEIVRETQTERLAYLVVGTHGRKGLGRFLLGSVSDGVLRRVDCPVVVMNPRNEA